MRIYILNKIWKKKPTIFINYIVHMSKKKEKKWEILYILICLINTLKNLLGFTTCYKANSFHKSGENFAILYNKIRFLSYPKIWAGSLPLLHLDFTLARIVSLNVLGKKLRVKFVLLLGKLCLYPVFLA